MRSKLLALAAAALAIAAVYSILDSRSDQRALHHDVQRFQAEIAELRGQLGHRAPPLFAGAAGSDVASLARREARVEAQRVIDDQAGSDDARPQRPPPVTFEQSQAAVFEAFGQERVDPAWSAEAALKLEAAVRGHLPPGSRLSSIQCHTTMCQIEMADHDANSGPALVMNAFRDWPGSLFLAKDRQEGGEHVVTIIASRDGHELPLAPR